MMELSEKLKRFARESWEKRENVWRRLPQWTAAERGRQGTERTLFQYLAGTLPLTDLGDYGPELVSDAVREGLRVREEFPWCAALPEEIFCKDLLCPRVNNEALAPCREEFRRELRAELEIIQYGCMKGE